MFLKIVRNFRISVNTSYPRVLARSASFTSRGNVRNLASKDGELRVFIVAGEVSSDIIASRFMKSLTKLSHFPVRFAGVGGSMMLQQGLNSLFPMEDISVMGIWELLPHLSRLRNKLNETVESALTFQPHVVLTVDSKGFSFRFLKQLRARYGHYRVGNPRHFHYVAPSFWAWKGGEARLKKLVDFVDHVFCILPFEEEACRSNGLTATFVGHPTLEDAADIKINKHGEEWKIQGDAEKFRKNHGLPSGSTIISVLPGSRLQEVTRMLSIFSRTMEPLKDAFSELVAVIHVAPNKHVEEYISSAVSEWTVPVILVPGGSPCMKYNSFSSAIPEEALLASWKRSAHNLWVNRLRRASNLKEFVQVHADFVTAINEDWFYQNNILGSYCALDEIFSNFSTVPQTYSAVALWLVKLDLLVASHVEKQPI